MTDGSERPCKLLLGVANTDSLARVSCPLPMNYRGYGGGGGSGGGFFLAGENVGRIFDHLFPARAFLKVEISSHTLIPLIRPESVHSGSAR